MTINVTIHNFRKIKEASFAIAPVALLVGENENGKSSIAQAVALAAAQQPLPRQVAKKDAKQLVHDGAKSGMAVLERESVTSVITWPLAECKISGQGKPVAASEFAVGLKNIFSLSNTEKVGYFIGLLKANPTLDDLKAKLPKSMDTKLPEIWKQIEQSGWDEAHSTAKTDEAELTGKWKGTTGEQKWNVSSAGDWRPATWQPDLERGERAVLEVNYAEAKKAYEDALKSEGAQAFDRTQAQALADKLPEYEQQVKATQKALEDAETAHLQLSEELNEIGYSGDDPMTCPDCGAHLTLNHDRQLTHAQAVDDDTKDRYHELGGKLKESAAALIKLREEVTLAQVRLTSADEATARLQGVDVETEATGNTAEAKAAYTLAEQRLDSFNTVERARALYEQILTQKDLVTALSQGGVRKSKLDDQLKRFNEEVLKPLSVAFGCEHVWLDGDLTLWRGNRPYHLLSRSARYTVRVIMQASIAMADRSELLVIDDMDEINDRRNRAGLMTMVQATGIPALVCMAKRPEENAPDLAARNAGQTYTVIEGVVQPYTAAKEANVA
jgi:tetratricopeptide (TPR) repeat protein